MALEPAPVIRVFHWTLYTWCRPLYILPLTTFNYVKLRYNHSLIIHTLIIFTVLLRQNYDVIVKF